MTMTMTRFGWIMMTCRLVLRVVASVVRTRKRNRRIPWDRSSPGRRAGRRCVLRRASRGRRSPSPRRPRPLPAWSASCRALSDASAAISSISEVNDKIISLTSLEKNLEIEKGKNYILAISGDSFKFILRKLKINIDIKNEKYINPKFSDFSLDQKKEIESFIQVANSK